MHPIHRFWDHINKPGMALCVMPISRIKLEEEIVSDEMLLLPPTEDSTKNLNVVSDPAREFRKLQYNRQNDLAWAQSGSTQIKAKDFDSYSLVVFPISFNWNDFFSCSHDDHKTLLRQCVERAETYFDLIRFDFCRLDLPDTLPGRVGMLSESMFSTALFYDAINNESYIIGAGIETSSIIIGIGLEIDCPPATFIDDGPIGNIARKALLLFRQTLEASSPTAKALQCFNMLEFLSSSNYDRGEEVRKNIASMIAKDQISYIKVKTQLEEWTKGEEAPRTKLVHRGYTLEDIFTPNNQRVFFRKMQSIICGAINCLIINAANEWPKFKEWRKAKVIELNNPTE